MKNDIISLVEHSPNNWHAKYSGNYGTYTIKIQLNENGIHKFSCSCPSDGYPCKHIAFIKKAIDERILESKIDDKEKSTSVSELLNKVSHKELKDFIVRFAQYNSDFANKIQLEFINKLETKTIQKSYSEILRKALSKIDYDYDDLYDYYESNIEIDLLDEWLLKAKNYILQNRFEEALAITKAIIEEYAEWLQDIDNDIQDYIDPIYEEEPLEILSQIGNSDTSFANELFTYCINEILKTNYSDTVQNGFHNLLSQFANTPEQYNQFLALQDDALNMLSDKSSYEVQKIIERKITFFENKNQAEKAWQLILDNIQIESFRKKVVEKKISEKQFSEAKQLINDFLFSQQNNSNEWDWNELLLRIAQKEQDIPVIRKLTYVIIASHYQEKYYRIYKSTFSENEWESEVSKIIKHYQGKSSYFSESIAEVYVEEKNAKDLMLYIKTHITIVRLETYYKSFYLGYPNETLELFQQALNYYLEHNTGREYYEYAARMLKKMTKINGGNALVKSMVAQYLLQYKNRRAMIEVFNKNQFL